jgi:hypothetical protein
MATDEELLKLLKEVCFSCCFCEAKLCTTTAGHSISIDISTSCLLILDNASIHHTDSVHAALDLLCADGFDFLFLPPYSPFLNPIEYAFLMIKNYVCHTTSHN